MATALVTGASFGIGEAFSEALAKRGYELILIARSQHKLEALATRLRDRDGVSVTVIAQDLLVENAVDAVLSQLMDKGLSIDLLINNAGFGDYGDFSQGDRQKQLDMIQLNIKVLVDLTHRVLPQLVDQGSGGIINVASIAAFQPMPYLSVYAATKAFVLSFSEALWAENRDRGVTILALCPGPTETKFMQVAGMPTDHEKSPSLATPTEVVILALAAYEQKASNVVTGGWLNHWVVNSSRFLPRSFLVKGLKNFFQPSAEIRAADN